MESAQSDLEEGGSDGWKQTGQSRKSSSMLTSMVAVLFLRFTKALLGGEFGCRARCHDSFFFCENGGTIQLTTRHIGVI
jgi:hypothetical protein